MEHLQTIRRRTPAGNQLRSEVDTQVAVVGTLKSAAKRKWKGCRTQWRKMEQRTPALVEHTLARTKLS